MARNINYKEDLRDAFVSLTEEFIKNGALLSDLKAACFIRNKNNGKHNSTLQNLYSSKKFIFTLILVILSGICIQYSYIDTAIKYFYGTRCFIPNNYLVWEFTRPVSNCEYCHNVKSALVLPNITREDFEPYAYSSRPMIIKGAASHWKASEVFSLEFFRNLYEQTEGAYESIEEECQFLHFKSNFSKLREVFLMSESRAMNLEGQDPWYVGWKNCHIEILEEMRKYYQPPHFLPVDAEIPFTNYIFLGYEQGAIMHLDYIARLMWQGQILGSKVWTVAPTPECDNVCHSFNFTVDTGDVILLDTRIWYHGTYVQNGKLSLTIASEYG